MLRSGPRLGVAVATKGEAGDYRLFALRRDPGHMRQLEAWTRQWQVGPEGFWDFDAVIAMLARPICRGYVMATSGEAPWAAVAFLDVGTFSADLLYIYVDPILRTRGVASAMLAAVIEALRQEPQLEDFLLEVRPSNLPAITLYQKHGFIEVGRRKRYYSNGEDALVLGLKLKSPDGQQELNHER